MLIYGYVPKSKKRKVPKAKKLQYEEWLSSINSVTTNFSKNKSIKFSRGVPSPSIPPGQIGRAHV